MGKPTRYGGRQQIKRKINMMRGNMDQAERHLYDIFNMIPDPTDEQNELFTLLLISLENERTVLAKFKERLIG